MGLRSSRQKSSELPHITDDSSIKLIHEITSRDEFDRLVNDVDNVNLLIVCDFYAMWCLPCLQIAPTLSKWAANDYQTNAIFVKINVDEHEDLANQFSIRVLPTFVLLKQGKEITRLIGADSTNLKKLLDQHI